MCFALEGSAMRDATRQATQSAGDLTCDGVVTGIQIKARRGDIAAYQKHQKKPSKPLWLQPVLVNREVENLRVFGL